MKGSGLGLLFACTVGTGVASAQVRSGVQREVRDRDYFYLWSFSAWSVWAGPCAMP